MPLKCYSNETEKHIFKKFKESDNVRLFQKYINNSIPLYPHLIPRYEFHPQSHPIPRDSSHPHLSLRGIGYAFNKPDSGYYRMTKSSIFLQHLGFFSFFWEAKLAWPILKINQDSQWLSAMLHKNFADWSKTTLGSKFSDL